MELITTHTRRITALRVYRHFRNHETVAQLDIGKHPVGTVIRVNGFVQTTNDKIRNNRITIGWALMLRYDVGHGDRFDQVRVASLGAQNITVKRHHDTRNFSYTFKVTSNYEDSRWLKMTVSSGCSEATSNFRIKVDKVYLQAEILE